MKRDMMKTVEKVKGHIPMNYDMTIGELQKLHEIFHGNSDDGEFDAFSAAFCYGYALGARAERAGKNDIVI